MSSRIACPRFEECDAPLCPVSVYLKDCCWYPNEPICRLRQYQGLDWIRKQKRIARKDWAGDAVRAASAAIDAAAEAATWCAASDAAWGAWWAAMGTARREQVEWCIRELIKEDKDELV